MSQQGICQHSFRMFQNSSESVRNFPEQLLEHFRTKVSHMHGAAEMAIVPLIRLAVLISK
jgi:hypothetical protein